MGTSRAYPTPTGGGWTPLKNNVDRFGGGGGSPVPPLPPFPEPLPPDFPNNPVNPGNKQPVSPTVRPLRLLSSYIASNGGAAGIAGMSSAAHGTRGRGGAGRSGTGARKGGSRKARAGKSQAARVGQNLGGFAGRVSQVGLAAALREFDLSDLIGRPAQEVATAIVDRLAGPGSTMDASLARSALNKLWQELLGAAKTFEDVERILQTTVEQVQVSGLLIQYFGHYLYERFARDFYEKLVSKIGQEKARSSFESIRRTIFASLRAKIGRQDPNTIDWRGKEGRQLADRILVETLEIFEAGK
jgi:hypothetical protein